MPHLERRLVGPNGETDLEGHPVLESFDSSRTLLLRDDGAEAARDDPTDVHSLRYAVNHAVANAETDFAPSIRHITLSNANGNTTDSVPRRQQRDHHQQPGRRPSDDRGRQPVYRVHSL